MKRAVRTALAVASAAMALAACTDARDPDPTDLGQPDQYANQLFDGVNEQRTAANLEPLEWSDCLATKAQPRAQQAASADTLEDYPLSQDVALDSALYDAAAASWVAARMRERLATGRLYAEARGWRRDALRLMVTDEIAIAHPRYLPGGRPLRVYSLMARLAALGFDVGGIG